ncbi:MAG TPA: alpha/beta fold hydrolase [Casimicrobiaceae bacterium]|nr:alpha/beta fold hydrolase [Casimicrobiaceae bacterium]
MNGSARIRLLRALAVSALLLHTGAHAAGHAVKLGGMDVTVWEPSSGSTPWPVVVFSHGFHGCATQSRFLMQALAAAGYIVFAPNHRDATCGGGSSSWIDKSTTPFGEFQQWNDSTYRDRAEDIRRLIDAIRGDGRYRERADLSRLALAGHSLGGYTVLGLAGAWPSWKLDGVKAVLALSPYSQPFAVHKTLSGLAAPVMYQSGTWDLGVKPTMHKAMASYDQSPSPKYYVEFDKVGHFAWADIGRASAREGIVGYSVWFLDHYVNAAPADRRLTQAERGVAVFHYASELGNK